MTGRLDKVIKYDNAGDLIRSGYYLQVNVEVGCGVLIKVIVAKGLFWVQSGTEPDQWYPVLKGIETKNWIRVDPNKQEVPL